MKTASYPLFVSSPESKRCALKEKSKQSRLSFEHSTDTKHSFGTDKGPSLHRPTPLKNPPVAKEATMFGSWKKENNKPVACQLRDGNIVVPYVSYEAPIERFVRVLNIRPLDQPETN